MYKLDSKLIKKFGDKISILFLFIQDNRKDEKLLDITEAVRKKIALHNSNIVGEAFSCREELNGTVVYRAKIISNNSAEDIVNEIDNWVKSETSITVDQVVLHVDPDCPAALESFESKDCISIEQSNNQSTSNNNLILILPIIFAAVVLMVVTCIIVARIIIATCTKSRLKTMTM